MSNDCLPAHHKDSKITVVSYHDTAEVKLREQSSRIGAIVLGQIRPFPAEPSQFTAGMRSVGVGNVQMLRHNGQSHGL